jgi:hypothetical protein
MSISSREFSHFSVELKFGAPEISSVSVFRVDIRASNFTCSGIDETYIIDCVRNYVDRTSTSVEILNMKLKYNIL